MGYERHSQQTVASAEAHAPSAVTAERCPARTTPAEIAVARGETDVLRQARQIRDEWRRERYARLKTP
jgi:hypothetical protein